MKTYSITVEITVKHTVEIEADNLDDALFDAYDQVTAQYDDYEEVETYLND